MIFIARLWLHATCDLSEYEGFEREAATISKLHGGRIERAFRLYESQSEDEPFEIHLVFFPNEAAFESYRSDPRTIALSEKRKSLIARTEIWRGEEVTYGF